MIVAERGFVDAAVRRLGLTDANQRAYAAAFGVKLNSHLALRAGGQARSATEALAWEFRRARKAPGLHELESVLLRYGEMEAGRWRDYVVATKHRAGAHDGLQAALRRLTDANNPQKYWLPLDELLDDPPRLPDQHPVRSALSATRRRLARLESQGLADTAERLEQHLVLPAFRQWVVDALRACRYA